MKEKEKTKKPIIALVLLLMVGVVGVTIAYFTNSETFDNIFKTAEYKAKFTETFESPDDWSPNQSVEKIVNIANTGNVDMAVVVSYTESWESKEGDTLSKTLTVDGKTEQIAVFTPGAEWIKVSAEGDEKTVYYLNYALKPTESVNFINEVTLNANLKDTAGITCTTKYYDKAGNAIADPKADGAAKVAKQEKECLSNGHGYTGGKYKLSFEITTVQYEEDTYVGAVQSIIGNHEVTIAPEKPQNP